jgi:hypothetical protein
MLVTILTTISHISEILRLIRRRVLTVALRDTIAVLVLIIALVATTMTTVYICAAWLTFSACAGMVVRMPLRYS